MRTVDPNPLWPRALLRRLLLHHRIGIGSRILVVGLVHEPLAAQLTPFGLQLHELDERPDHVLAARREHAELRIDHWREGEPLPLADDLRFDLVLVRDRAEFHQASISPRVTQLTADLLSVLVPGGSLVFAGEFSAHEQVLGHSPDCLGRMLSEFSGTFSRTRIRRSLWSPAVWHRLLTTGRREAREMISLTIPDTDISRTQWRREALRISGSGLTCCQTAGTGRFSAGDKAA